MGNDGNNKNFFKKSKKRRLTKRSKASCGLRGAHLISEPLAAFLSSDDARDTFGKGRRRQPSAEQRERKR